jgi:hypothetical protein
MAELQRESSLFFTMKKIIVSAITSKKNANPANLTKVCLLIKRIDAVSTSGPT